MDATPTPVITTPAENIAGDWTIDFSELGGQTPHTCPACKLPFLGARERTLCAMCFSDAGSSK